MAKKRHIPAYVHHKPSGQARVRINGTDLYLGVYGSPESKLKYDDLIAEHVINSEPVSTADLNSLLAAWWAECKRRYGGTGKGKYGNAVCWRPVIRLLRKKHGNSPAERLGPATLRRTIETAAKENEWSLRYARDVLAKAKAIFKWAKNDELVSSAAYERIRDVQIRDGRQTPPIEAVDDSIVDRTLPSLKPMLSDMVRFQRLTGMRPGELVEMRHEFLDRSGDVWIYTPIHHKNAHRTRNNKRNVYIGPRAQALLARWILKSSPSPYIWARGAARAYSTDSYRRAIHRAIDSTNEKLAKTSPDAVPIPRWSPHQLRKAAATKIRSALDVESAASVLGHSSSVVTQEHYAAADRTRAIQAAKMLG